MIWFKKYYLFWRKFWYDKKYYIFLQMLKFMKRSWKGGIFILFKTVGDHDNHSVFSRNDQLMKFWYDKKYPNIVEITDEVVQTTTDSQKSPTFKTTNSAKTTILDSKTTTVDPKVVPTKTTAENTKPEKP